MQHELGQRAVEPGILERDVLGASFAHADARMTRRALGHERGRRIEGRHPAGAQPSDQLAE